MTDPKTLPPWTLPEVPAVLTYIYPPRDSWEPLFELQWDYQVDWPGGGRPSIRLLRFRSYQKKAVGGKAGLVEDIIEDIPVNEAVMIEISKHAAGYLYATSDLDGGWRFTDRTLFGGCEEAAKKRFNLSSYRQIAQADPNPRI